MPSHPILWTQLGMRLRPGAATVSLNPSGSITYSRVLSGTFIAYEEVRDHGQPIVTWNHTLTQSVTREDNDLDGFYERVMTATYGITITDQILVITEYNPTSQSIIRRETSTMLNNTTKHIVREVDDGSGQLTLMTQFDKNTRDVIPGTFTQTITATAIGILGDTCTPQQIDLVRQRLKEGMEKGTNCLHQHGMIGKMVEMWRSYKAWGAQSLPVSCPSANDYVAALNFNGLNQPISIEAYGEFFRQNSDF